MNGDLRLEVNTRFVRNNAPIKIIDDSAYVPVEHATAQFVRSKIDAFVLNQISKEHKASIMEHKHHQAMYYLTC